MKSTIQYTYEMIKEGNRDIKLTGKISLWIGLAAFIGYIVSVWFDPFLEGIAFLAFVAIYGGVLGIMLLLSVKRSQKNYDGDGTVNEYEFLEEYFTIHSSKNGDVRADAKLSYDELWRLKETQHYLFLFINQITVYPVEKSGFSEAELNLLRGYVKEGVKAHKQKLKQNRKRK